jgi:hypothetical protein
MQEIQDQHLISEKTRTSAEMAIAKGKEVRAFCWELTFPELSFEPNTEGEGIRKRERPGFDAMVGNPPWDKLEPKRKEFFAQYDPAIRDFQGQTLGRRISQLAPSGSEAWRLWRDYESRESSNAKLLINGGVYHHQVVEVNGEKTGGKPDLFKVFLERFHQLSRQGGRVAVLMPAGLYSLEGATGMRRMLFAESHVEAIYSFENWGKRFFQIHPSFKFITLAFEKQNVARQSFPAAFMLRDEGFLAYTEHDPDYRSVRVTSEFIQLTNPTYLSIIELRDDKERKLVERIYSSVPPLSKKLVGAGGWNVEFHRELNMTDDAWRFRRRDWLLERGCKQNGSFFTSPNPEWYQSRDGEFVSGVRYIVPEGTKYRVTSQKPEEQQAKRGRRGITVQSIAGYLLADRALDEQELPVVPGVQYVPLYEGRMVHQFDHAAKAYVSGEGRGAKWRDLDFTEKALVPHFYVDGTPIALTARAGFCDVTGQTNERSSLAALIPEGMPAGNSVPVVTTGAADCHVVWLAFANSIVGDFLIRQKISTHLNIFFVESWPLLRPGSQSSAFAELRDRSSRLCSITAEIQLAEPAFDLRERARLRAEIDAIVAGLYDLSPAEFACILTAFPLLDRDQPPLPDDFFVRWNKQGKPKFEPRSYVTRDTALLAYFRHRGIAPPEDLVVWYRDEVKVNMIDDEFCLFRMGPMRNLEQRVTEYSRLGAIAYIPSKAKKWGPNGPYQPRTQEVIA